jgi:cytochrome c2
MIRRNTLLAAACAIAALSAPLIATTPDEAEMDAAAVVQQSGEAPDDATSAASEAAQAAEAAAWAAEGEAIYRQRCAGCHGAIGASTRTMGPKLAGVYGRKAGTGDGRYSPALANSGITWDAQTLDAFLADPAKAVPGTRMAVGLADETQRTYVIAYISSPVGGEEAPAQP